jgi:hypothetical protein
VDWEDIEFTADWWAIQAGIEEADTFVFIISPDSAASEVCSQEINHAAAHNKRLVPIVYREVPPDQVPEKLQHLNWLFFRASDDAYPTYLPAIMKNVAAAPVGTEPPQALPIGGTPWMIGTPAFSRSLTLFTPTPTTSVTLSPIPTPTSAGP